MKSRPIIQTIAEVTASALFEWFALNLEFNSKYYGASGEYSYLQVARTIYGEEDEKGVDRTQERECRSLEQIQDNYPKYILSLDYLLQRRSGIFHKNIVDLMSKNEGFTGLN